MEDNEIIVNKDLKIVYCDNIIDNGRSYRALASGIFKRYLSNMCLDDIFDIILIYNKQHVMVAEYEFVYNKTHGMALEVINMNQTAIDIIVRKEGSYIEPDVNVISEELALKMYNKFKEVFGCK